jgi:hypothetical protein
MPVGPGQLAYVSGRVRTEGLLNHSANMKVFYMDETGQRVAEKVVNQEGIYRSTGWIRFVEFRPLPEEIAFLQVAFWAYPNGRQPSREAGHVYFGDLRIETGPLSSKSNSGSPAADAHPQEIGIKPQGGGHGLSP